MRLLVTARLFVPTLVVAMANAQTPQTSIAIPDNPVLIGTRFYHKAIVLDPSAGNALGAVMSDAAVAVVGDH